MENQLITINAIFSRGTKPIRAKIVCKDNYAILSADDTKFVKDIYKSEIKQGSKVRYNTDYHLLVKKYDNKIAQEIAAELSSQLKNQGATVQVKKE